MNYLIFAADPVTPSSATDVLLLSLAGVLTTVGASLVIYLQARAAAMHARSAAEAATADRHATRELGERINGNLVAVTDAAEKRGYKDGFREGYQAALGQIANPQAAPKKSPLQEERDPQ